MLPVVVLAGGRGTRVDSITQGQLPKAMLPLGDRPFIDRKLDELARHGVSEVILLVGHGEDVLREHFAAAAPPLGVRLVSDGASLLGTGGAIASAADRLPARFWVTYGDTLLDAPMEAIERDFLARGLPAMVVVVHNEDRVQPSNTSVEGGLVVGYSKGEPPGRHDHLDYGLLLFDRAVFEGRATGQPFDLGDVLRSLVARRELAAYVVDAEFHDIGTPEAWQTTDQRFRA
jgi:D-glycero-D-manno-heptose 1,7-bisphosphate phosphatase